MNSYLPFAEVRDINMIRTRVLSSRCLQYVKGDTKPKVHELSESKLEHSGLWKPGIRGGPSSNSDLGRMTEDNIFQLFLQEVFHFHVVFRVKEELIKDFGNEFYFSLISPLLIWKNSDWYHKFHILDLFILGDLNVKILIYYCRSEVLSHLMFHLLYLLFIKFKQCCPCFVQRFFNKRITTTEPHILKFLTISQLCGQEHQTGGFSNCLI